MDDPSKSPRIRHLSWGRLEVEGGGRSQGMQEMLHVCPETLTLLKQKGIPAYVLPT